MLRLGITIGVAAGAILVAVLLILIVGGVLILPAKTPAPVTISSMHLVVQQGNSSTGFPWFGPSSKSIYYTVGFPLQVAPGGNFSIVWANFINFDSQPHTIKSVGWSTYPATNVSVPSTLPALPDIIPASSESHNLAIYLTAPNTPGATYAATVVVTALVIS